MARATSCVRMRGRGCRSLAFAGATVARLAPPSYVIAIAVGMRVVDFCIFIWPRSTRRVIAGHAMAEHSPNMKQLNTWVSREDIKALEELARHESERTGYPITKADLVRRLIQQGVAKYRPKQPQPTGSEKNDKAT